MGEFFKGWRPKAGLVTLALAMALIQIWVTSQSFRNVYCFGDGHARTVYSLDFCTTGIMWQRTDFDSLIAYRTGWSHRPVEAEEIGNPSEFLGPDYRFKWRRQTLGFDFGLGENQNKTPLVDDWFEDRDPLQPKQDRVAFWLIPYWSLVLPLTLLSAWLILGKSMKVKPAADFRSPARDESIQ